MLKVRDTREDSKTIRGNGGRRVRTVLTRDKDTVVRETET